MSFQIDLLPNTAFSQAVPGLQIAWDSTSMGTFKECPYKYWLTIVCGYQSRQENVHFKFGIVYHSALETYDKARALGTSHEAAQVLAVRRALEDTWDRRTNRPWYSENSNKNRATLVRTVVWYLEQFGQDDKLLTVVRANGHAAVELSFRFNTGYKAHVTGEPFLLCGHFDKIAAMGEQNFIVDRKTTRYTLDERYFAQFSPHNQFSTYMAGGKVVFDQPIHGLIVDAAQIMVTFSRFMRAQIPRTDAQLGEWFGHFGYWLNMAQTCAQQGEWPQNDKSCGNYGGCEFLSICSKPPADRQRWLDAGFTRRTWDPLVARSDV